MAIEIRQYRGEDQEAVIALWQGCGLIVPWNDPRADIRRKVADSAELFFVGQRGARLVASCMAGYDGHRGWIYYLAVEAAERRRGCARQMIDHVEERLAALGCPKLELMVRNTNVDVSDFYRAIGYVEEPVVVLSKRLLRDEAHGYCLE